MIVPNSDLSDQCVVNFQNKRSTSPLSSSPLVHAGHRRGGGTVHERHAAAAGWQVHIGLCVQSVSHSVFNTQFHKLYLMTNHYVACNAAFPAFERVFP